MLVKFYGIETIKDFYKVVKRREDGTYMCLICQYSGQMNYRVRLHVESKHFPNTFTFNCPKCDVTVGTKKGLQNHIRKHHE